jgi:NAD(P)-dependent dehydrogenase (short-subunit alcohol dehydrogenase family)
MLAHTCPSNFAGIVGKLGAISDTKLDDWKKVIDVNLTGVWLSTKHELRQMLKQDSVIVYLFALDPTFQCMLTKETSEEGRIPQKGSIVNCASVNSIQAGAGTSGYSAAKHGVMGITKTAALEARGSHIRVNAVSPGFLLTRLLQEPMDNGALTDDSWKVYEDRQGRKATFDEIGDVVVLLSTPRMSLVNGHNLVIDNGFTINENTV